MNYEHLWGLICKHPNENLKNIAMFYGIETLQLSIAQHYKMRAFITKKEQ